MNRDQNGPNNRLHDILAPLEIMRRGVRKWKLSGKMKTADCADVADTDVADGGRRDAQVVAHAHPHPHPRPSAKSAVPIASAEGKEDTSEPAVAE